MTTHTDLIANLRSRSSKAGRIKVLSHGFFIALEPWRALTANVEFRRGEALACNAGLGAKRPGKD